MKTATYEVWIDNRLINFCDYCFSIRRWTGIRYVVESHLSTKESMQLFKKAVKEHLVPMMKRSTNDPITFCKDHNVQPYDLRCARCEIKYE